MVYNAKYKEQKRKEGGIKMEINTFDIVRVDFGEVEFAGEQGGIRPAVVIQNKLGNIHSSTTIVIPFTTKIKHLQQPTHSLFYEDKDKGLSQDSMLLGECVRQVSKDDCNIGFTKTRFCECSNILEEAATVAKVCDDFMNQLRVFSEVQTNVIDYDKRGSLNTILIGNKKH